jgi:CheY-like chemotaxis protein
LDVVLMDVRMPDGDGMTALGRIKLDKPDRSRSSLISHG